MASKFNSRSGVSLFVVLAALVLCTSVMLTLVNSSLRTRRQIRTELQMEQTRWLVDAGIRKGFNEIKRNKNYEGETIELSSLSGKDQIAVLEISIFNDADKGRVLKVVASLTRSTENPFVTKKTKLIGL